MLKKKIDFRRYNMLIKWLNNTKKNFQKEKRVN